MTVKWTVKRCDVSIQWNPACTHAKSLQSCPTLCNAMDCNPPGSSVHGILQARMLEWVAMPSSRGLPNPGIKPTSLTSPALAGRFFTTSTPGKLRLVWKFILNKTIPLWPAWGLTVMVQDLLCRQQEAWSLVPLGTKPTLSCNLHPSTLSVWSLEAWVPI